MPLRHRSSVRKKKSRPSRRSDDVDAAAMWSGSDVALAAAGGRRARRGSHTDATVVVCVEHEINFFGFVIFLVFVFGTDLTMTQAADYLYLY